MQSRRRYWVRFYLLHTSQTNNSHCSLTCHNHTIVPFSIAIKRMSEILLYKANQCLRNLNRAQENVREEQEQLDTNVDRILDEVNASFQVLFRTFLLIAFAFVYRVSLQCWMRAGSSLWIWCARRATTNAKCCKSKWVSFNRRRRKWSNNATVLLDSR